MLFSPGVGLLPMSKHQQPWRQRMADVWHVYKVRKNFLNSFRKYSRHRGCNKLSKTTNETVSPVTKPYRKPQRRQWQNGKLDIGSLEWFGQHVIECCVYVWRLANLGRQDASRRRGGNSSPSRYWSSKGGRGTSIKLSYYLIISAHTNLLSIKSPRAVISSRPAPPLSQILCSAGNHLAASWKAVEQHS